MDNDAKLIFEQYLKHRTLLNEEDFVSGEYDGGRSWASLAWEMSKTGAQIIDPSGVLSWGDVYRAGIALQEKQTAFTISMFVLAVIGAIPNFGLVAGGVGGLPQYGLKTLAKSAMKAGVKDPKMVIGTASDMLKAINKIPYAKKAFGNALDMMKTLKDPATKAPIIAEDTVKALKTMVENGAISNVDELAALGLSKTGKKIITKQSPLPPRSDIEKYAAEAIPNSLKKLDSKTFLPSKAARVGDETNNPKSPLNVGKLQSDTSLKRKY